VGPDIGEVQLQEGVKKLIGFERGLLTRRGFLPALDVALHEISTMLEDGADVWEHWRTRVADVGRIPEGFFSEKFRRSKCRGRSRRHDTDDLRAGDWERVRLWGLKRRVACRDRWHLERS
jgi:hypothetical protein